MQRIGFILGGLRLGGYEVLTARLANALARKGHSIHVLSLSSENTIADRFAENVSIAHLDRNGKLDFKTITALRQYFQANELRAIIAADVIEYFYAQLAAGGIPKKQRPKLFKAFHMTKPASAKGHLLNLFYSLLFFLYRPVNIAIHRSQIDFLNNKYFLPKKSFQLIYNGIDTDLFQRRNNTIVPNKHLRFIHVASIKPLKDHWTLFRALAIVNHTFGNWELQVVGKDEGQYIETFMPFLKTNQIDHKITFTGPVDDVRFYLNKADIFFLTSVTEALSLAAIEALGMSVPAILSDVGGNPDIVEHGKEGLLFEVGNTHELARHILRLAEKPEQLQKMSRNARAKVIANFSLSTMVEKYERVLAGESLA
jgi:glycosyltransferase involved in cell wall biosynthesis